MKIVEPQLKPAASLEHLHPGERDVILTALSLNANLVRMDEAPDRATAEGLGLATIGTVGILDLAIRTGLVDGPAVISHLRTTSFRASPRLLALLERSARKS